MSLTQVGLLAGAAFALAVYAHMCMNLSDEESVWSSPDVNDVAVRAIALSATARTLAIAGADGSVRLFEVGERKANDLYMAAPVHCLAFSPDGLALAGGCDDSTLVTWGPATGSKRTIKSSAGAIRKLAFSPDGRALAAGDADGTVRLWGLASRGPWANLGRHRSCVSALEFSSDGRTLASGCAEGQVIQWDVSTGKGQTLCNPPREWREVPSLAYSPGGMSLAVGYHDGVTVWDVAQRRQRAAFGMGNESIQAVRFSADGRLLFASTMGGIVHAWDIAANRQQIVLRGQHQFYCSVFSNDGRFLAAAGDDKTVRVWDLVPALSRLPTAR